MGGGGVLALKRVTQVGETMMKFVRMGGLASLTRTVSVIEERA